jgi:hypothetical protein
MKEIFKDIPNYEGLYQVSNYGRVKSLGNEAKKKERILKPATVRGYQYVSLKSFCISIHRLVAITFIPNPKNKKTVNHKDGIKANNKVSNLEWNTHQENINHAKLSGLLGSKSPYTKRQGLKYSMLERIKKHIKNKTMTKRDISFFYNIDIATVNEVAKHSTKP